MVSRPKITNVTFSEDFWSHHPRVNVSQLVWFALYASWGIYKLPSWVSPGLHCEKKSIWVTPQATKGPKCRNGSKSYNPYQALACNKSGCKPFRLSKVSIKVLVSTEGCQRLKVVSWSSLCLHQEYYFRWGSKGLKFASAKLTDRGLVL